MSTEATPAPSDLVFMDTETTGLSPNDHIWEFAAIRRRPDGTESVTHCFVEHDLGLAGLLPESFRIDHDTRYNPDEALTVPEFVDVLNAVFAGRPHVVGAVPNFDTERFAVLLRDFGYEPSWHYHIADVENMAVGWLRGRYAKSDIVPEGWPFLPPWNSDDLSRVLGVKVPDDAVRHTALGDVRWAMAIWDVIFGGAS